MSDEIRTWETTLDNGTAVRVTERYGEMKLEPEDWYIDRAAGTMRTPWMTITGTEEGFAVIIGATRPRPRIHYVSTKLAESTHD